MHQLHEWHVMPAGSKTGSRFTFQTFKLSDFLIWRLVDITLTEVSLPRMAGFWRYYSMLVSNKVEGTVTRDEPCETITFIRILFPSAQSDMEFINITSANATTILEN